MAEIRFNLTVDSMFDLCEVLDAIGMESIAEAFSKEDLEKMQSQDAGAVGMTVIMKVSGVLIKQLPRVRNEVYKFLAGCAEWDDGTPVTVEVLRKMKISQFVKLIRDFLKTDGIMDFFEEAAGSLDMGRPDSKSFVTGGIAMPMGI